MTFPKLSEFPAAMLTGLAICDDDHREIFNRIRRGIAAIDLSQPGGRTILRQELVREFREHFSREEKHMLDARYPHISGHIAFHREFIERLTTTERLDISDYEVALDALDVLFRDALIGDQEFAEWFRHRPRRPRNS